MKRGGKGNLVADTSAVAEGTGDSRRELSGFWKPTNLSDDTHILQLMFENLQEPGGGGSVNGSMIKRERQFHYGSDKDAAVPDNRFLGNGADSDNRHLGQVYDGRKAVDLECAQTGNGDAAPRYVIDLKAPLARFFYEGRRFLADSRQVLFIRILD
jgi:hypothetical protein